MISSSAATSHPSSRGPKVVIIGAGSAFFGRQTIAAMVNRASLQSGCLALADTDETKLRWMHTIAQKAIRATGVSLTLEASTDYRSLLKGADFVILAFAVEGVNLREVDTEVSTRHGMIMCSADTVGPGGIMRTLREIPLQTEILNEVRRVCPQAWVINWVNPTAAMGIGMMRHFPDLKTLAICDGPHNPRFDNDLIIKAGLACSAEEITDELRSRVLIRSTGVNHFNWLVEMRYDGEDVTPRIFEKLREDNQTQHIAAHEDSKKAVANRIAYQIANTIGYAPMCVWHTQEYLPYFQGHDLDKEDAVTIIKWRVDIRRRWMNECWDDMQAIAGGQRSIEDFLEKTPRDHATDIIDSMWSGVSKRFYINTPNRGAVSNMPDDAYLELLSVVDRYGVRPLPFGEIPRPLLGYIHRVLDEHELAVEAATTYSRKTLLQSFLASMVSVSIPDAENCMNELLEVHRPYLPEAWYSDAPAPAAAELQGALA